MRAAKLSRCFEIRFSASLSQATALAIRPENGHPCHSLVRIRTRVATVPFWHSSVPVSVHGNRYFGDLIFIRIGDDEQGEDQCMTPTAHRRFAQSSTSLPELVPTQRNRARRIAPADGMALEKLAHAIEYLTDELTLECMTAQRNAFRPDGAIAAIEMLKKRNREIYLACPFEPTFGERVRSWLGRTPRSMQISASR